MRSQPWTAADVRDLLVNNAGGIRPAQVITEDGFECAFATNHLGPFAFTGLVLGQLLAVPVPAW